MAKSASGNRTKSDGNKTNRRGGKGGVNKKGGNGAGGSRGKKRKEFITASGKRPKHQKLDIKFDPESRRNYLTSLSSKKQERRAFGLAMQKVKDRKAKLQDRKEQKEAVMTQIEEAERMKKQEMYGIDYDSSDDSDNDDKDEKEEVQVQTFEDAATQNQFGGQVIVTTSYGLPSDSEDEDDLKKPNKKKRDDQQVYAGSVQKYMDQLKKNLPSTKKHTQQKGGKKGKHGAASMIGGSGKDLKMAQRTLSRVEARKGNGGGSGKKGKGRR
mmetsp:Transcript_3361/g.3917  ORF Transcript_3361/g.3917 Transcript_3361/m.3917 type:complete len:269 (+) Transcript_3361:61-867(+)